MTRQDVVLTDLHSLLDCSANILVDNCSEDISKEKNATEDFPSFFSILDFFYINVLY